MNWKRKYVWMGAWGVLALMAGAGLAAGAQVVSKPESGAQAPGQSEPEKPKVGAETGLGIETQTKITPAQAKELFRSVDEILKFSSDDSKLADSQQGEAQADHPASGGDIHSGSAEER